MINDNMKYHHLGIPTKEIKENETFLPQFGFYISGYDISPYNIEWMRFLPESTMPQIIQNIPHVAFEVENLELAVRGKNIIIEPNSPSEGIRVAFIEDNGAPIEFIELLNNKNN